jgi:hypothetical protein
MLRAGLLLAALTIAGAVGAHAEIIIRQNERPAMQSADQVRVTVGVNMFIPVTEGGDQSVKAQEDARRAVYNLAEHECVILRDVMASDCHVESININVSTLRSPPFGQQKEGLNVNGNISFRILPK